MGWNAICKFRSFCIVDYCYREIDCNRATMVTLTMWVEEQQQQQEYGVEEAEEATSRRRCRVHDHNYIILCCAELLLAE